MWSGQQKTWVHYRNDIIASDVNLAIFLSSYLRQVSIHKLYVNCTEVADLQRYKLIRHPQKVKTAMRERSNIPFVFALNKN
ncbi:hypothetical protein CAP35_05550 [Chitinophagaceae bacterium IBVUCB1]|nr:hypothetical protein CAP35_05550 [Chitinophagaceae bacterium IBVUCB1]